MSIKVDVKTPNKKDIAELLRSIANMIQNSANETVTVSGKIIFNTDEE